MSEIPLIDLQAQYRSLQPRVDAALTQTLTTTRFIGGPEVESFEKAFADYLGVDGVISCGNGTDALELLFDAMDIGPGDEVIVPAMTWISTSEAVATRGATPIFVDIDPATACLDPALTAAAITERTRAIIVVALYGNVPDMDALLALGPPVIEDAAQAHGATHRGRKIGSLGAAATFSFFPSKSLGAYGDAGCVVAGGDLGPRVRALKNHGMPGRRHVHTLDGRNSRMDALQAAVLNVKLPHLDDWIARKRQLAARYRQTLGDRVGYYTPEPKFGEPGCHLFVISHPERGRLAEHLTAHGIGNTVHYPTPPPLQSCYAERGHQTGDFPHAERLSATALSLPLYAELTDDQVDRICQTILDL